MEESNRQKKFSKLVQKELSEILAFGYKVPGAQILTVSVVRTPPDLGMCKVYISTLPDEALVPAVAFLNEHTWQVRHLLAGRIRQQVRHIPELHFFADDTTQYAANIDRLFSQIRKDEDPAGGEEE